MTNPGETSTQNTAEFGSYVGIQGGWVHNSTVYMESPDASPRQKYETGVRFLQVGVPARARELITETIAKGYEDGEVRFHWVLAMLSKRAYRDLNTHEREQLSRIPEFLCGYADDEWKRALEAIHDLLECLHGSGGDAGPALKAIHGLAKHQRDLLVHHLDLVLTGGAKEKLWTETREAARAAQLSGDRVNRVWAYFQPEPVEARAREPIANSPTSSDRFRTAASTTLFMVSAGYLGLMVFANPSPLSVIAYPVALGAVGFGFGKALRWHYRVLRLRAKELAHSGRVGARLEGGFAARVDASFKHYFTRYAPKKMDPEVARVATAGILAAMRDEIIDLYRESGVKIDHVNWLIRYLVSDMVKRWAKGTLREYREQWRTPPAMRLTCLLSFAVFVFMVRNVAVDVGTHLGTGAAFVLVVSGAWATWLWTRILGEKRRFTEEHLEYEQVLADRQAAYQRWKKKLEDMRPDESAMEAWLSCDKTLLMDDALRHYELAWRDVIAHACLQTPAKNYKRARVPGCPWRYSRYDMRLFLVTRDGVREYRADFDFVRVETKRNERNNFRFDAVTSVGVVKTSELTYTLKLTLNNGPSNDIRVVDATPPQPDTDGDSEEFSKINLDAAGFTPTLHILEGIAAEGKSWLRRDPQVCG